jgi:hypothetical protein
MSRPLYLLGKGPRYRLDRRMSGPRANEGDLRRRILSLVGLEFRPLGGQHKYRIHFTITYLLYTLPLVVIKIETEDGSKKRQREVPMLKSVLQYRPLHPNIQYTTEKQINNKLNYLDITIENTIYSPSTCTENQPPLTYHT